MTSEPRITISLRDKDDLGLKVRAAPGQHFYVGHQVFGADPGLAGSDSACRRKGCGRPPDDAVHLAPGGKPERVEQRQAANG